MEGLNEQEVQAVVKYWQDRAVDMENKFVAAQVENARLQAAVQALKEQVPTDSADDEG